MNLNIVPNGAIKRVHISQNDVGRTLTFNLFNGSTQYDVPVGATVKIQGTKPSGFGFSETCTVSGNVATVDTTSVMTDEHGYIDTELQIKYNGNTIGTSNFVLAVEKNPHPDTTTDGSMETIIPELTLLVNEVKGYAEEIEGTYHAYGSPWVASTVAEMTDTDKVYVYVGNESGYTNGNWYYYTGNAWVSGGIYNSTAFETDTTLSVSGMAADAQATGVLKSAMSKYVSVFDTLTFQNGYWYKTNGNYIAGTDDFRICAQYSVNKGDKIRYTGHRTGGSTACVILLNGNSFVSNYGTDDTIGEGTTQTYDIVIPSNVTSIKVTYVTRNNNTQYHYPDNNLYVKTLQNVQDEIDNIENEVMTDDTIACWGDSLTQGVGSGTSDPTPSGYDYPYTERLQELVGASYTVVNGGNGGDSTIDIGARQGGFLAHVKAFTIPGNNGLTPIEVYSPSGEDFTRLGRNLPATLEPVTIGGTTGNVFFYTINGEEKRVYQRRDGGTNAVTLARDELIIPSGIQYKNCHAMILWSGTNDGDLSDTDKFNTLVDKQKSMIEFARTNKWLVLGLLGNGRTTTNQNFAKIYGSKFIDIRTYLSRYGLSDNSLTPTTADTEAMNNGYVPPQLMADGTHLNAYGYKAVGNCIYYHGKQLGYWS